MSETFILISNSKQILSRAYCVLKRLVCLQHISYRQLILCYSDYFSPREKKNGCYNGHLLRINSSLLTRNSYCLKKFWSKYDVSGCLLPCCYNELILVLNYVFLQATGSGYLWGHGDFALKFRLIKSDWIKCFFLDKDQKYLDRFLTISSMAKIKESKFYRDKLIIIKTTEPATNFKALLSE